ncbi:MULTISPECIES: glycine-rich domain-containing protein [unclassified Janthinobacterium]|uniref:glycine-rich domain-containing protein n=1 Tax=unclassified Janthinobacterium TaxID=2610881 RepID=UPI000346FD2A|nr:MULTISPECIES: hypothetical protein [unclassified Janthinobacterium]MEC5162921.1 hypothetical protein [Janthinobacterium sp. CG_S6]
MLFINIRFKADLFQALDLRGRRTPIAHTIFQRTLTMHANDNFKTITELDLDPIKVKLMHRESGEGWSLEKANAVEFEYRRFLILMKQYPTEQAAPLFDVDTFWHYHILDTMKYSADCDAIFGHFMHHFPYIGLRGEADEKAHQRQGERMRELYEGTFGEDYLRAGAPTQAAWSARAPLDGAAAAPQTAWSARATLDGAAAAPQTAWSARATLDGGAAAPQTAWSARVAIDGAVQSAPTEDLSGRARFYSERPSLPISG